MSDTLEKAKELALSLSLDEQAELGAILQDSLFEQVVSDEENERIASVIRERIDGPFIRIDDVDAHLKERTQAIRDRLAKGIRKDGSDA